MKAPALVLGSYINSLSAVRGLAMSSDLGAIWLLSESRSLANHSRFVERSLIRTWGDSPELLVEALIETAGAAGEKMTLIPTHDFHVKVIGLFAEQLREHFYLSVNPAVTEDIVSKKWQYELCEKIGVPYPKTSFCESGDDAREFFGNPEDLSFPLLLKPFSRAGDSGLGNSFRALTVAGEGELAETLRRYPELKKGGFLASEIVPGGDDDIWAYTAFLPEKGHVHAGWVGRKLSQHPPRFGVFASAEAVGNDRVAELGKKLVEATGHVGIAEPEFKYDARDGTYKLMEINPRVMMWHACGLLAGVNLVLMQHYHSAGQVDSFQALPTQQDKRRTRFVFLSYEARNFIFNPLKAVFLKQLVRSIFYRNKTYAAFWWTDPLPGLMALKDDAAMVWSVVCSLLKKTIRR